MQKLNSSARAIEIKLPWFSTIIVPQLDPGVDKHTRGEADGYRSIMDICWKFTIKIASLAMNVVEKNRTKSIHSE